MSEALSTLKPQTLQDLLNTTSLQALGSGRTVCEMPDGQTIDLSALLVCRVSHSVPQEIKEEKTTSDISCPTSSNWLDSADLTRSLASRCQALLDMDGLTIYTMKWSEKTYTVGSVVLTAAGSGKPHIRQRIYWVANTINEGSQRRVSRRQDSERENINRRIGCDSTDSRMGNTNGDGCKPGCETAQTTGHRGSLDSASGIDWLYCRDGKHRPVRKGINPLIEVQKAVKSSTIKVADGATGSMVCGGDTIDPNNSAEARTIRLKGYGNAIVAPVAEAFIRATMEVIDGVKTL